MTSDQLVMAGALALSAAFSVALSNLIAAGTVQRMGAFAFNRLRLLSALVAIGGYALFTGKFVDVASEHLLVLCASALIGIVLGDTAVFAAMGRIGPQLTSTLYSTNAMMAAVMAGLFLGETLNAYQVAGILSVITGVVLAILYRGTLTVPSQKTHATLLLGIGFGLMGALGQALSVIMLRPYLRAGLDPIAATSLRVLTALLLLTSFRALPFDLFKAKTTITHRNIGMAALSGLLGMALGMTLVLAALRIGQAGYVATLASTTPIMLLPMVYLLHGERPRPAAWFGTAMAFFGIVLLMSPA
jgi:drug/metabolite transporter (DMT)-like permease